MVGSIVRTPDVIRGVVEDLLREVPPARIASRFHATLADVIVEDVRAPPRALRARPRSR